MVTRTCPIVASTYIACLVTCFVRVMRCGLWDQCVKQYALYIMFLFRFLDRVFSIMKTKINQQNAQINSGLIYY